MAINSYEINDIYDVAPENSEFQQAVRRTVPTGHTFKGMRFINDYIMVLIITVTWYCLDAPVVNHHKNKNQKPFWFNPK